MQLLKDYIQQLTYECNRNHRILGDLESISHNIPPNSFISDRSIYKIYGKDEEYPREKNIDIIESGCNLFIGYSNIENLLPNICEHEYKLYHYKYLLFIGLVNRNIVGSNAKYRLSYYLTKENIAPYYDLFIQWIYDNEKSIFIDDESNLTILKNLNIIH